MCLYLTERDYRRRIMGKTGNEVSGNKSQSAQLKGLVRQAFISVAAGAVLLLGFIVFNMGMSSIQSAQINTTVR